MDAFTLFSGIQTCFRSAQPLTKLGGTTPRMPSTEQCVILTGRCDAVETRSASLFAKQGVGEGGRVIASISARTLTGHASRLSWAARRLHAREYFRHSSQPFTSNIENTHCRRNPRLVKTAYRLLSGSKSQLAYLENKCRTSSSDETDSRSSLVV